MPISLNTNSYFANLFGRIQLYASASNQYVNYKFVTGIASSVSPSYTPANQVLNLNLWNYITVSQRVIQVGTSMKYEI